MSGTGLITLALSHGANSFPALQTRRAVAFTALIASFFMPSHTHHPEHQQAPCDEAPGTVLGKSHFSREGLALRAQAFTGML